MALTIIGSMVGAPIGIASQVAGQAKEELGKITRFATHFDIGIVVDYGIRIIIITAILILVLQFARGLFIAIEQIPCGIGTWSSVIQGDEVVCDPTNANTVIKSVNWAWDLEWYLLCFFFFGLGMIMGSILYIWLKKLLNLLLNIEDYLQMMEQWIYGEKKMFSDENITS